MRSLKLRAGSKSGLNPQSKGLSACKELARNLMKCNNPCWKLKMLALQQRESYPPFQMPSNHTKKFSSIFYEWVISINYCNYLLESLTMGTSNTPYELWGCQYGGDYANDVNKMIRCVITSGFGCVCASFYDDARNTSGFRLCWMW